MKILHVNKFHYCRGGSEAVYFQTARILESHGHRSLFFSMHHPENAPCAQSAYFMPYADFNSESGGMSQALKAAGRILYSIEAKKKIEALIKNELPDIAHLHNIHHQVSPSIVHSLKRHKIPIVMTLHDLKMSCASYAMLNNGTLCESCRGNKYYHCFLKRCVKGSAAKSLLNTIEMYLHHSIMRIYESIDIFISPSLFLRDKLREMGFRKNIVHLNNFVDTRYFLPCYEGEKKSILYFGRLSKEKGLFTLLEAVKKIPEIILKIAGKGPLEKELKSRARDKSMRNIIFLGYKSGEALKQEIRKSMFVVLPSECYENNPLSVIEGFALGKPAIGSRLGGIPELIQDNHTGALFEPGNSEDLKSKIAYLMGNPQKTLEFGKNARRLIESEYTPELYYQKLNALYASLQK